MMYDEFIRSRITELRMKQNISEYKMSLDLGHSKGYIQSISSGRTLPSMTEFLAICDYLGITPKDFFSEENSNPVKINEALSYLSRLDDKDLETIIYITKRLAEK